MTLGHAGLRIGWHGWHSHEQGRSRAHVPVRVCKSGLVETHERYHQARTRTCAANRQRQTWSRSASCQPSTSWTHREREQNKKLRVRPRGVIPACSPNGQILHIVARATPCVVYYAVRGATFWTKFVRKLEEQDVHWRIRGDELGMDPAYQRPGCHTLDAPLQLEEEGGHSRDQQVEQPTDTANHDTDTRATEGEPQLGPSQTFHVPEAMLQRYAPSLGCEMSSVYRVKSKPQRDLPSTHDSVDLPGGQ